MPPSRPSTPAPASAGVPQPLPRKLEVRGTESELLRYVLPGTGRSLALAPPVFEIDSRCVPAALTGIERSAPPRKLPNGATEYCYRGSLRDVPDLALEIILRMAADSPIIRFRYRLLGEGGHRLTKSGGCDNIRYLGVCLAGMSRVTEVRLGEFNEMVHSFELSERPVEAHQFEHGARVIGPILVAEGEGGALLVAYEHGAQVPDTFLDYRLAPGRTAALHAVKGNYTQDTEITPDAPFETVWFHVGMIHGDAADLAAAYRDFILRYQAVHGGSRAPLIFYNTWANQERDEWWNGREYLTAMHEERILREIEVAHRMGVEVFVLDTGWYEKTGDWRVNRLRFPGGLANIRARLEQYDMRLGLWFGPTSAALSSRALWSRRGCVMTWRGEAPTPWPVWGTEESLPMCLVSDYADAFADELIRLHREVGVTYFKWDGIGQYGCDDAGHHHGGASTSPEERADRYAFEQVRSMCGIVEKVTEACPDAIVDFDITEGGRSVGLAFLSVGKYFLVNNGPYYGNFDIPEDPARWSNVFVRPGAARAWFCRRPIGLDKWIPSVLFLTHYLPDDPGASQLINLGSLILGQNGLWGDLLTVSEEGVARFADVLAHYRQVRDDMTATAAIRTGPVGGTPEIYEKIHPVTGRGAVVVFASVAGVYDYVTHRVVDPRRGHTPGTRVEMLPDGRARIVADFRGPCAEIAFLGVEPRASPGGAE